MYYYGQRQTHDSRRMKAVDYYSKTLPAGYETCYSLVVSAFEYILLLVVQLLKLVTPLNNSRKNSV